jgi:hypothetical protein
MRASIRWAGDLEAWRDALDEIQRSQPLLSVRSQADRGGKLYFQRVEGNAIPMSVLYGASEKSWQNQMATTAFPVSQPSFSGGQLFPGERIPLLQRLRNCR